MGERWWWLPPYSALPCFYSNSFTSPLFLLDRDFLREKINESREAKDRLLPLERATINSSVCPLRRFWLSFSSSLFLQSLLISWFEEKRGDSIYLETCFRPTYRVQRRLLIRCHCYLSRHIYSEAASFCRILDWYNPSHPEHLNLSKRVTMGDTVDEEGTHFLESK